MNARSYLFTRSASAVLIGLIVAGAALNAQAQPRAGLDQDAPVPVTLMPELTITASASNPSQASRWRLAAKRPQPMTLMPSITVRPDPYVVAAEYMVDLPALAATSNDASGR